MEFKLKEQFFEMIMRFKKIDFCVSSEAQLQPSEMAVMVRASSRCLYSGDGVCVSEIHEALYISKAAVSQTLNALEKKGYILRQIDPVDRRKIVVTITAMGEAELDRTMRIYNDALDAVLDQLGHENAEQLIDLIGRLMDIMNEINNQ